MSTKENVRHVQELRRSSAASRHTPRPRKGTRNARVRAALRDQQADRADRSY